MASVAKRKWTHNGVEKEAWMVRYTDRTGARRGKQFARKKEADAYRAKVETELNAGTHIARGASKKISEAAAALMEEVEEMRRRGVMRDGTVMNYEEAFRIWIVPYLGERNLTEIEPADIEDWLRKIAATGRLSPKTVTHRLWYLKATFELAIRRKWLSINPVLAVRRDMLRTPATRIREFDVEEVRHLLAVAGERRKWTRPRAALQRQCVVATAAFCGLRFGEIMGLKAKHLDLEKQRLTVRHTIDRVGKLNPPKTVAGNRTIAIPGPLVLLLRHYTDLHPPADPEALVFTTDEGKPVLQPNFYLNGWRPLLRQAGLENPADPVHFHALRHFAGSWMIEHDWPLPDVAKALGHSDVSMTLRVYAHTIARRALSTSAVDTLAENLLNQRLNDASPALLIAQG